MDCGFGQGLDLQTYLANIETVKCNMTILVGVWAKMSQDKQVLD